MNRISKTDFAVFKDTCVWIFRIEEELHLLHALNVYDYIEVDEISQVGYADSTNKVLVVSPTVQLGDNLVLIDLEKSERHSALEFVP